MKYFPNKSITNGFFSKNRKQIDETAKELCAAGVNDVMLSVDVFHQETIPLDPVVWFAEALLRYNAPRLRVHPAWVVNEGNDNPYNTETKRLLKVFTDKGIKASKGNNIFPSGNALKHLGKYYPPPVKVDLAVLCGSAPYTTKLDAVDCIGITSDGGVHVCSEIGNVYQKDILNIIDEYDPYNIPVLRKVLDGGVAELLRFAESKGVIVDINGCLSACGVCRKVRKALAAVELEDLSCR